jgi:hypothetical protein
MARQSSLQLEPQSPHVLGGARVEMQRQIERLERQLSSPGFDWARRRYPARFAASPPLPGLQSLGQLERCRDELVEKLSKIRQVDVEVRREQAETAERLADMLTNPRRYKFVRIHNEQLGLPGCKAYYVRPRLGLIGMLAGWWHVKISSGCP